MSESFEKTVSCEVHEDQSASWKCTECDEFFCNQCRLVHVKSKATRDHEVKCIKELPLVENKEEEDESKCRVHKNEAVQRYCDDCKCLICFECSVSEHNGHSFLKITDAVQQEKEFITNNMERLNTEQLATLKTDLKQIREIKQKYKRDLEDSVEEIRKQGDNLKRGLDEICQELETVIQKQCKEDEHILDVLEIDLSKKVTDVETLTQFLEQNFGSASTNALFKMSEKVKQGFHNHQCMNIPLSLRPPKFLQKEVNVNALRNLFGDFEHDDLSSSDIDDSPPAIQESIILTFKPSFSVGFLAAVGRNVWVANATGDIAIVTQEGKVASTAHTTVANDIAADRDGNLFVAQNTSIRKVKRDGSVSGFESGLSYRVRGITITDTEEVLVILVKDKQRFRIRRFSLAGQRLSDLNISRINTPCLLNNPRYLTNNVDGKIWIQDEDNGKVFVVDNAGKHTFDYMGSGKEQGFCPEGLVHDQYGHVLIVDSDANCIHLVDRNGVFLQFILHRQGLDEPFGITLDIDNNIWVGTEKVFVVKYLK